MTRNKHCSLSVSSAQCTGWNFSVSQLKNFRVWETESWAIHPVNSTGEKQRKKEKVWGENCHGFFVLCVRASIFNIRNIWRSFWETRCGMADKSKTEGERFYITNSCFLNLTVKMNFAACPSSSHTLPEEKRRWKEKATLKDLVRDCTRMQVLARLVEKRLSHIHEVQKIVAFDVILHTLYGIHK